MALPLLICQMEPFFHRLHEFLDADTGEDRCDNSTLSGAEDGSFEKDQGQNDR